MIATYIQNARKIVDSTPKTVDTDINPVFYALDLVIDEVKSGQVFVDHFVDLCDLFLEVLKFPDQIFYHMYQLSYSCLAHIIKYPVKISDDMHSKLTAAIHKGLECEARQEVRDAAAQFYGSCFHHEVFGQRLCDELLGISGAGFPYREGIMRALGYTLGVNVQIVWDVLVSNMRHNRDKQMDAYSAYVRQHAVRGLGRFIKRNNNSITDEMKKVAVDTLLLCLADPNIDVRRRAGALAPLVVVDDVDIKKILELMCSCGSYNTVQGCAIAVQELFITGRRTAIVAEIYTALGAILHGSFEEDGIMPSVYLCGQVEACKTIFVTHIHNKDVEIDKDLMIKALNYLMEHNLALTLDKLHEIARLCYDNGVDIPGMLEYELPYEHCLAKLPEGLVHVLCHVALSYQHVVPPVQHSARHALLHVLNGEGAQLDTFFKQMGFVILSIIESIEWQLADLDYEFQRSLFAFLSLPQIVALPEAPYIFEQFIGKTLPKYTPKRSRRVPFYTDVFVLMDALNNELSAKHVPGMLAFVVECDTIVPEYFKALEKCFIYCLDDNRVRERALQVFAFVKDQNDAVAAAATRCMVSMLNDIEIKKCISQWTAMPLCETAATCPEMQISAAYLVGYAIESVKPDAAFINAITTQFLSEQLEAAYIPVMNAKLFVMLKALQAAGKCSDEERKSIGTALPAVFSFVTNFTSEVNVTPDPMDNAGYFHEGCQAPITSIMQLRRSVIEALIELDSAYVAQTSEFFEGLSELYTDMGMPDAKNELLELNMFCRITDKTLPNVETPVECEDIEQFFDYCSAVAPVADIYGELEGEEEEQDTMMFIWKAGIEPVAAGLPGAASSAVPFTLMNVMRKDNSFVQAFEDELLMGPEVYYNSFFLLSRSRWLNNEDTKLIRADLRRIAINWLQNDVTSDLTVFAACLEILVATHDLKEEEEKLTVIFDFNVYDKFFRHKNPKLAFLLLFARCMLGDSDDDLSYLLLDETLSCQLKNAQGIDYLADLIRAGKTEVRHIELWGKDFNETFAETEK
ncbi:hypothetical protein PCE1_001196 [Barthelona sp. PCE]